MTNHFVRLEIISLTLWETCLALISPLTMGTMTADSFTVEKVNLALIRYAQILRDLTAVTSINSWFG